MLPTLGPDIFSLAHQIRRSMSLGRVCRPRSDSASLNSLATLSLGLAEHAIGSRSCLIVLTMILQLQTKESVQIIWLLHAPLRVLIHRIVKRKGAFE